MNRLKTILVLFIILTMNKVSAQEKNACRYTKTPEGYLMVLRQGDDVLANIENLAKTEHIPSANFSGIGFASEVTFGFYDFSAKKFNPKTFSKVEMGSLTGSIARFNAYGGHILSLHVGTGSMEIYISTYDRKLERKLEQPLNANVLQLNCQQEINH
jgi:predicted DNA-binding protein with PD1-like motif